MVRVPPGRRATCRSARNRPIPPRLPVRAKADRQASGSSREAMTATASPSSPGTSRPSAPRRAEPICPLTASSSSPAAAAGRQDRVTHPAPPGGARPDRRHSSTTGRRSVRRAASTTATQAAGGGRRGRGPGQRGQHDGGARAQQDPASAAVAAQPARAPTGQRQREQQHRLGHPEHDGPPAAPAAQLGQGHIVAARVDRVGDRQEQQQQAGGQQLRGDQHHRHLHRAPAGLHRLEGGRDGGGDQHLLLLQRGGGAEGRHGRRQLRDLAAGEPRPVQQVVHHRACPAAAGGPAPAWPAG